MLQFTMLGSAVTGRLIFPEQKQEFLLSGQKFSQLDTIWMEAVSRAIRDTLFINVVVDNGRLTGKLWHNGTDKKVFFTLHEDYPEGIQQFQFLSVDTNVALQSGVHERGVPVYTLGIGAPFAVGENSANMKWLNNKIHRILVFSGDDDIKLSMKNWIDINIKNYRTHQNESWQNAPQDWHWTNVNTLTVSYNQHGMVALYNHRIFYKGASDEVVRRRYFVLDVKEQKPLQLADILRADSMTWNHFFVRTVLPNREICSADDSIGLRLLLNNHTIRFDNFTFSEMGIIFVFSNYNAIGKFITILIPWEKLKPWLNPEFAQRMGLHN